MARILAYTSPARGHLYPLTPILEELRDRGHQVHVRTLASEQDLVRSRGFEASAIRPDVEALEHDDWQARSARDGLMRSIRVFAARAEHDAPDLLDAVERTGPDAVLVDVNSWGALAAAERIGVPWASFCPYPLPIPSVDAPAFGPGLPPARGPLGRVRDRVLRPVLVGTYERALLPPVNEVRSGLGLDHVSSVTDLFGRAPTLLSLTGEPFEYPRRDWPANVVMVGPCDWDPPAEAPAWLDEDDRPIVLVTTSSELQDDGRLAEAALAGLTGAGWRVVITVSSQDPGRFAAPDGARVERFVPHSALLGRAVCAVTHGGMGATQKALVRGVPVCAVPFGRDQAEVARRVEVSGAGVRLTPRRLTPARLRAAVEEAVARTDGARRLADALADLGGPVRAAQVVEDRLLGTLRSGPAAVG
jgi:MGT family glycosyltransferase